jgi:parvulin-like peptidyl-prolyl isomerase
MFERRTGRFVRGFLLAFPIWLAPAGCGLADSNKVAPPAAPANPMPAVKPQQSQDVIPASALSLPPTTAVDGQVAVRIVAYVNRNPIYEHEVLDGIGAHLSELESLAEPERTERLKKLEALELDRIIEREVIYDEAVTRIKKLKPKVMEELQKDAKRDFEKRLRDFKKLYNLQTDEQLKQFFASGGVSLESMRRQMERQFVAQEYMRNLIYPDLQRIPQAELREYYDKHADEFQEKERVKWQDIFLDRNKFPNEQAARQFADRILARLRSGEDFSKVSKELTQQGVNLSLSETGVGELPGEIKPAEVEQAIFRMNAKEVGGPIEMPGGYHILRVSEHVHAGRKPYDAKLQADILAKLQNTMADRVYKKLLEEMKSKAIIQVIKTP